MSENLNEIELHLNNAQEALALFGNNDKYLKLLEKKLDVSIVSRGEQIRVSGADNTIPIIQDVLIVCFKLSGKESQLRERDIVYAVDLATKGKINQFETLFEDEITKNVKGKSIRDKNMGQKICCCD